MANKDQIQAAFDWLKSEEGTAFASQIEETAKKLQNLLKQANSIHPLPEGWEWTIMADNSLQPWFFGKVNDEQ